VLVVHATLPMAAALAEAPPAPASHHDHVSAEGEAGCQLFHDELECMLCRVLSAHPLAGQAAPALSAEGLEILLDAVPAGTLPVQSATPSTLHARAPPLS
jgi:hypothetical protein